MATYTIQSEGNPIVPMTLLVTIPIDISATYTHRVVSDLEGQEFIDFFDAYSLQTENAYKTISEFTTQDYTRNHTFNMVEIGPSSEDPNKTMYDITINFTIENAVAETTWPVETDLTGTAKDEYLQSQADLCALYFKSGRNWVDL